MDLSLRDLIIATVAYADIFDYPLTGREIWKWLILTSFSEKQVKRGLTQMSKTNSPQESYFCLPGRKLIISARIRRKIYYNQKTEIAGKLAQWLILIPTVKFVGLTGGVAMGNADRTDDIDLLFIVNTGTIWISRLLVVLVTDIFGKRRKAGDTEVSDKICLNMFMTDRSLELPDDQHDLYLAHEILQMKPLVNKQGIYREFLLANSWVKKFLPNAWKINNEAGIMMQEENTGIFIYFTSQIILWLIKLFEPAAKLVQLWYMQKRRTRETVSDNLLMFHPRDTRGIVYAKYHKSLTKINIPIDKVFY